ncbi:MAG: A/G-specific adenine glycosylase [Lentilitoribacter sp.]
MTKLTPHRSTCISERLLTWYDKHHRQLPWRISPSEQKLGVIADPYHVWLSEIMLQQTTVTAVKPYFDKFVKLWPKVENLADASSDSVMQAWAGLGYYSRARNLKKCADLVATEYGGHFPETEAGLIKLPGIGPYTAAAIAAIAFNQPAAVVDGNIERVFTRLFEIKTPLPAAKPEIKTEVAKNVPSDRPGDFAQGLMDLGSSICTPKKPNCLLCPLQTSCQASARGEQEHYPVKLPKKAKPKRQGAAFVLKSENGAIYLQKRPDTGLLADMSEVPTTDWTSNRDGETGDHAAPLSLDWRKHNSIKHVFTHFELTLVVYSADISDQDMVNAKLADGWWSDPEQIKNEALPNLMKKVIAAVEPDAFK